MIGQAELLHQAIYPLGGQPVPITPMLLLDIEGVLEGDEALLEEPDVEIHIMRDRPKTVIAHDQDRGVVGDLGEDRPDASIERLPEFDVSRPQRGEFGLAPLGLGMGQIPDVPELMLRAVDGHEVEQEQVPLAPGHQEFDRLEVLLEEILEVVHDRRLVPAVVDLGRPGRVRLAEMDLEFGEECRIGREVGCIGRAQEVAQEEAGKSAFGRGG